MKKRNSKTFGLIILGIGIIALLGNFGLINVVNNGVSLIFSLFWPALLIFIGVKRLQNGKDRSLITYGLIAFGIMIILDQVTNAIPGFSYIFRYIVPTLIIALGLMLILKPNLLKNYIKRFERRNAIQSTNSSFENYDFDDDTESRQNDYSYTYQNQNERLFDKNAESLNKKSKKRWQKNTKAHVFNSSEPKKYRRINNRLSSHNYNLREKDIVEGDSYIEINTTMGETYLTLPKTINIKMNGSVSIGEIKFISKLYDGLSSHPKAKYTAPNNSTKTLHIQANVSVGEIYILLA